MERLERYVFDEFGAHVYEEVEEQIVYVDEETGGYCKVADGGIATSCGRGVDTYRVLKRVNDNIVKVAFK